MASNNAGLFNITVFNIQVYAPISNAEAAEVEQFYEDLQDLLELTPKKDAPLQYSWASLVAQLVKNPPAMRETWVQSLGSVLGLRRSPGEGKGYPLQYSGLENSMDCTAHGVTKSQTLLSNVHFQLSLRVNNSICCACFLLSNITVPRQPLD